MNTRKKIALTAVGCLLLALLLGTWFYREKERRSDTLTLYGNIDIRQVDLGFRVFGKLKAVYFEEGDAVCRGELLAELDAEPYVHSLQEAAARATSVSENLANARAQLKKRSALVGGKSVSEEDYQQALYTEKSLAASLREAEAARENALIRLQDTKLTSPSKGVVYTRIREPGTVLNTGEPVYSVAVAEPVWARTYISEPDLGKIYPGMKAEVLTDTPSNPVYQAHIGYISPIAEFTPKNVETPDLRTNLVYQVRVIIDSSDQGLRQGMPVTVKLKLR